MTADQALEAWEDAKRVEGAYRFQAKKAQRAYMDARRYSPRSPDADGLYQLHREALGQWAKAQKDVATARASWVSKCRQEQISLHESASRALRPVSGPIGGRNGARPHRVPARPVEGKHGLPA